MKMKLYQRSLSRSSTKFGAYGDGVSVVDDVSFVGYDKNQKAVDIKISGPQILPGYMDMNTTFEVELTLKYIPDPEPITISIK